MGGGRGLFRSMCVGNAAVARVAVMPMENKVTNSSLPNQCVHSQEQVGKESFSGSRRCEHPAQWVSGATGRSLNPSELRHWHRCRCAL